MTFQNCLKNVLHNVRKKNEVNDICMFDAPLPTKWFSFIPNIALITCLGPQLGVFLLISAYIIAVARSLRVARSRPENTNAFVLSGSLLSCLCLSALLSFTTNAYHPAQPAAIIILST